MIKVQSQPADFGRIAAQTAKQVILQRIREAERDTVFENFAHHVGEIITAQDPAQSSVTATVNMDSIDTRQEQRDAHIRSADFFDVGNHTEMTFRSTAVKTDGADWTVQGDLTIKGITKPVTLELELNGFGPDAYGGTRAGFTAKTEISRKAFGVDIDMPMDGGGVVVGDKINVELEIEAVLRTA